MLNVALLGIIAVITSMFSVTQSISTICPTTNLCDCNEESHEADCSERKPPLTSIPKLPSYIYKVKLDGNYFPNISKDTFSTISENRISVISLSDANIQHIDTDAFETLNYLQSLDLSNNKNMNITSLKLSLFSLKNNNLTSLRFESIGWKNSSLEIFSGVHRNITELSIWGNPLEHLSAGTFNGLEKLMELEAISTRLTACDEGLKELRSLLILDISLNDISVCNTNVLPQKLTTLQFERNNLFNVPDFCSPNGTSNAPSLKRLDLRGNNIIFISNRSFDCLPSLIGLVIAENPVRKMALNTFHSLTALHYLDMSTLKVMLTSLNISFDIPSLTLFDFHGNTVLPNITKCKNLEVLILSGIKQAFEGPNPKTYFRRLPKLQRLSMDSMNWQSIPDGFFKLFPNLIFVNLAYNDITTITNSLFSEQPRIKRMLLSGNRISHIGYDTFPTKFWQNIEFVDLSSNPFACDCSLLWFRDKFKASPEIFMSDPEYKCLSPLERKGILLSNFNLTSSECKPKSEIVTVLLSTGSIVVVAAISFLVLYRGRWYIRYWVYLLRYRRSDYRRLGDVDLQYDAFVIYADEDSEFVHHILLPKLEDEENIRLCIHFRDFQPGKIIADNIVESMGSSRMAIVVLSKNFCNSSWCKFELIIAEDRWLNNESEALLLVMLDDLESNHVTSDIRALIRTTTYVTWTDDNLGQRLFWEKVVNTLRRRN